MGCISNDLHVCANAKLTLYQILIETVLKWRTVNMKVGVKKVCALSIEALLHAEC